LVIGLTGFSCNKKQKITTPVDGKERANVPDYQLNENGYLHFSDAKIFNSYLKNVNFSGIKTVGFVPYRQNKTAQKLGILSELFNEQGLIAVGDELFKLEGVRLYKKPLLAADETYVIVHDSINLAEMNAMYGLPICGAVL